MKKELELKLVECYPSLYKDYGGDPVHTCMHWGFECGDGWFNLIFLLSYELDLFSKTYKIGITADQVKQKFGYLRFYYHTDKGLSWFESKIFKTKTFLYRKGCGKLVNKLSDFRRMIYKTKIERINEIIEKYEVKSGKTCESCGDPGKPTSKGWIRVLCDKCNKERMEK